MEQSRLIKTSPLLSSSSLLSTRNNLLVSSLLSNAGKNNLSLKLNEDKSGPQKRHISDYCDASPKKQTITSQGAGMASMSYGNTSSLSKSLCGQFQTSNKLLDGKPRSFSSNYSKPMSTHLQANKTIPVERKTPAWTFQTKENTMAILGKSKGSSQSTFSQNSAELQELVKPSLTFPAYPDLEMQEEETRIYNSKFKNLDSNERRTATALLDEKEKLLQFVSVASGSLAQELKQSQSETRTHLEQTVARIVKMDPEFILKLALYCRQELNLRLISNLLVALSAKQTSTSYFLKKYYSSVVRLPSDWLMVANLFLTVGSDLAKGSLPTALRKVMKEKFAQFDEYQLAKYNKSISGKKIVDDLMDEEEKECIIRSRDFDIKRLIRLLHINAPSEFVMAILGKKYPVNNDEFRLTRLDGVFDQNRAGKRMKLKTPETWETQIAIHGNKPEVWQKLIDDKKLPYMASVRNIRNILLAGVSESHIQKVAKYISNETAVSKSRMFPFQYFTAYDILKDVKDIKEGGNKSKPKHDKEAKEKEKWMLKKEEKQKQLIKTLNISHIETLRKALDKAVNIAARNNIPPLKGITLILCAYGLDMNERFTEARGVSQKGSTIRDAAALFSLMCHQAAEDSKLVFYSVKHVEVSLPGNDILSNVDFVKHDKEINKKIGQQDVGSGANEILETILSEERWVDNIIIFHGGQEKLISESQYKIVQMIRQDVNPNMLFANINICGKPNMTAIANENLFVHPNDLSISGFTDSIFHLIVNKGNGGQLAAVEMIDRKHSLITLQSPLTSSVSEPMKYDSLEIPQWQQVRIFLSSTFLDMQGERNILHQFVLPQLQKRAKEKYIQVDFVDLRWGLSQESLKTRSQVEQCLEQIKRCDLFVGILGERYGWVPDQGMKDDLPQEYEDIKVKTSGKEVSMTEMEMEFGALSCIEKVKDRAFFYFRNSSFCSELSEDEKYKFTTPNEEHQAKLLCLKEKISKSGLEVMTNYPAECSQTQGENTIVVGLQDFGTRVLNNLWNAIDNLYPCLTETEDSKLDAEFKHQAAFCDKIANNFVGRQKLVTQAQNAISSCQGGIVSLTGAEGTGTTALLAKLAADSSKNKQMLVVPFFKEATLKLDMKNVLQYFLHNIGGRLEAGGTIQSLTVSLKQSLEKFCATKTRVLILVDDLQELEDWDAGWIPNPMPENAVFVIKTKLGSKLSNALKKRNDTVELNVKVMDMKDKIDFCKSYLEKKGKSLEESAFNNQLQAIVSKRGAGSPSYLKLVLSKISKEANFETLSEDIKKLGSTKPQVLEDFLIQNEMLFGVDFVRVIMLFISQSKCGLTGSQICTLVTFYKFLESKKGIQATVETQRCELERFRLENVTTVSLMDICLCLARMEEFFVQSFGFIQLSSHSTHVVHERYIKSAKASTITDIHTILASYFLDLYRNDLFHPTTIISLPHHLGACGDYKLLKQVICTPSFIQLKCTMGLGVQLYKDFMGLSLKFRSAQEKFSKDQLVEEYRRFVKTNLETLLSTPCLIPQIIMNEPQDSALRKCFMEEKTSTIEDITAFNWCNGPKTREESKLMGYTIRRNYQNPTSCLKTMNGMLISGFSDGSILVSDGESQEDLFCLVGHSDEITGIDFFSPTVLVTGSKDGWLSSWDMEKRIRLSTAKAHERRLSSLSARHPILVTTSWDGTIKVWDKDLKNISRISPSNGPLNCILVHPRKDLCITGGWDNTIRVWDLVTMKQKAVLRGHNSSIQAIKLTEDARKIISGSLDGTVKIWDCNIGMEVASFNVGQSCSTLEMDPQESQVFVGGSSGVVTSWPLALGKQILTCRSQELLTGMHRQFVPSGQAGGIMDPTSLAREISAVFVLDQGIWTGFKNGDVQLIRMENKMIKSKVGWKVFNSEVKFLGGKENYDLASESMDWNDMMDEEENKMDEEENNMDDDASDDLESMDDFFMTDVDIFDNPLDKKLNQHKTGKRNTIWMISDASVWIGTLINDELEYSVKLEGVNSEVTDMHIHEGMGKDLILLFSNSGMIYVFDGHPATRRLECIQPIKIMDSHHGGIVKSINLGRHFEKSTDADFLTIGQDNRIKSWKIQELNGSISISKVYESSDVFLSKPAGIELIKLRDKSFLYVALEDGTLIKQEVKLKPGPSETSSLVFGSKQNIEGNGNGIVKMYSEDEFIILEHLRGLVSLWSTKGSEMCQYDKKSTATFFTNQSIMGKDDKFPKLFLANTDMEILSPFESECLEKFCGHQGELKGLLTVGSETLITSGVDGKVRHWNYTQISKKEQTFDKIVGIKFISGPNNITDSSTCNKVPTFLVLSKTGTLGYWVWDREGARQVSCVSLEPDTYELMSAVGLEQKLFMVTAARNGKVRLCEVIMDQATLEAKVIFTTSINERPLALQILLDEDDKQNDGQFSLLYTASNMLSFMKARTKSNQKVPALMVKGCLHLENWEMAPNYQNLLEQNNQQINLALQELLKKSQDNVQNSFLKLHKRGLVVMMDSTNVAFHIVMKDDGIIEIENCQDSSKDCRKIHDKVVTGMGFFAEDKLVTCSQDGKLKAWSLGNKDSLQFDQIGEFAGHGPAFSAMEVVGEKVVVGDTAGNVFCLAVSSR
eukprot:GFUD01100134.1.p1 GENE.GFUD01100134.1~~GFUD01100134.1.p1  ORF type:complete len:2596 (+),score=710.97 GFUD01100134.1:181-7968(+)